MPECDASGNEANIVIRKKKRVPLYRNAGGGTLPRAKRLSYRLQRHAYSETDTPSDDSPTTPRTMRTRST